MSGACPTALAGLRILIVEDEPIVAMLVEDCVASLGCEVVSIQSRIPPAISFVESALLDAALLDLNLNGLRSYPIADALTRRGVPFAFVTGYGAAGLDESYRHHPVVQKPFACGQIAAALADLVGARDRDQASQGV